jgi:hypothetical protein
MGLRARAGWAHSSTGKAHGLGHVVISVEKENRSALKRKTP